MEITEWIRRHIRNDFKSRFGLHFIKEFQVCRDLHPDFTKTLGILTSVCQTD